MSTAFAPPSLLKPPAPAQPASPQGPTHLQQAAAQGGLLGQGGAGQGAGESGLGGGRERGGVGGARAVLDARRLALQRRNLCLGEVCRWEEGEAGAVGARRAAPRLQQPSRSPHRLPGPARALWRLPERARAGRSAQKPPSGLPRRTRQRVGPQRLRLADCGERQEERQGEGRVRHGAGEGARLVGERRRAGDGGAWAACGRGAANRAGESPAGGRGGVGQGNCGEGGRRGRALRPAGRPACRAQRPAGASSALAAAVRFALSQHSLALASLNHDPLLPSRFFQ